VRRALATPLPRLSCAERPCRPPRRLSCADRPMLNNCRLYNHYHLRGEMPAVEYLLQAADPTNRVPLSLDVVVRIAGALQIWEVVRCASWSWGRGHYHDATKFASSLASASIKRDILYHALGYRPATYLLCFMVRSSTRPATQRTRSALVLIQLTLVLIQLTLVLTRSAPLSVQADRTPNRMLWWQQARERAAREGITVCFAGDLFPTVAVGSHEVDGHGLLR
jgi:hypothetical protein